MAWTHDNLQHWYESPPGQQAAADVRAAMAAIGPLHWNGSMKPLVLGVGYVAPFVNFWPTALVDEATDWNDTRLECRYDRIVVGHGLETAANPADLLAACWKALRPDGVLTVVAPNRLSLWRWYPSTPLAEGKAVGRRALQQMLQNANFKPIQHRFAVACPWGGTVGHRMCPHFGGLLVMAATKHIAGMKVLARTPATGKVQAIPVGVATFGGK